MNTKPDTTGPLIRNAHAYLAGGLLVVEWRREDKSGVMLMIDEDGEAKLFVKDAESLWATTPGIKFKLSDGWPKELLDATDIDREARVATHVG